MTRTATFATALIALGFVAQAANAAAPAPVAHTIMVLDAPHDFPDAAAAMGFGSVEAIRLDTTAIHGFRIAVPAGTTADGLINVLKARFPAATIDAVNDDFQIAR